MKRPAATTEPTPFIEADRLYSVTEVAALWSCSEDHVYALISTRKLASVQIATGRAKTRIPASVLNAYVAAQLTKPRRAATARIAA